MENYEKENTLVFQYWLTFYVVYSVVFIMLILTQ